MVLVPLSVPVARGDVLVWSLGVPVRLSGGALSDYCRLLRRGSQWAVVTVGDRQGVSSARGFGGCSSSEVSPALGPACLSVLRAYMYCLAPGDLSPAASFWHSRQIPRQSLLGHFVSPPPARQGTCLEAPPPLS